MNDETRISLPELDRTPEVVPRLDEASLTADGGETSRGASDLEAVFDVPVQVSAVLGRTRMDIGDLLRLGPGAVLELPGLPLHRGRESLEDLVRHEVGPTLQVLELARALVQPVERVHHRQQLVAALAHESGLLAKQDEEVLFAGEEREHRDLLTPERV